MKTLAIIPARAGSKRIPHKNTRHLCGRPLLQYSIEHAMAAKEIDRIVVTTDDPAAAKIAEAMNCDVIERPEHLASDYSSTHGAVVHALEKYKDKGKFPDYVIMLQPTVPIRELSTISESIQTLESTACDSVISCHLMDMCHPSRVKKIENGKLYPYMEVALDNVPRSELPSAYCRNGSIYAFRSKLPFEQESLLGNDLRPVITQIKYFVNIDTIKDWLLAEALINHYGNSLF